MTLDTNTATVIIALLAFLGTLITAFLSYRTEAKVVQARLLIEENFVKAEAGRRRLDGKVEDLHDATNSRLSQLIEEVKRASRLEGRLLGIAEEMARSTAAAQDLVRSAAAVLETKKEDLS